MYLLKILGIKKTIKEDIKSEPKFIDEDLSVEEIDKKMGDLPWDEAEKYVKLLSPNKKSEALMYASKNWSEYIKEENEKCIKEHGTSLYEYLDVEHPVCDCD